MKKILLLISFMGLISAAQGQTSIFGGLAYSNIGPKAQLGIKEYFDEGGFTIKTSAAYSYELIYESQDIFGDPYTYDRHHAEISSVILFDVNNFDLGGGFAYRYFLPEKSGSVGLVLTSLYNINDRYSIEGSYTRTIIGDNYVSLGVNFSLF